MSPPDLLFANSLSLSRQLKSRIDQRVASILRANHETQFAQTTSELAAFRDATAGLVDNMDDATLSDTFQDTVRPTTYDVYLPFVSKFFERPCLESEVTNLLAPGLPDYVVRSSSTSGGVPKAFPKYNCLPGNDPLASAKHSTSDPASRRITASVFSFVCNPLGITDENDCLVKTANVTFVFGSLGERSLLGLHPDNDEKRLSTLLSDHTAPYAAGFVTKWVSFLLVHALFALGSRSVERINTTFVTTLVEMMNHIDAQFDMIVDCIANGTIPDVDGIAHVRHHLESAISPDPERAAELRSIGRPSSRLGWCSLAWPNLRSVRCTSSGAFASSLPLARAFLGPNVQMLALRYACSEGLIASPYDPRDLEHYKLSIESITEFLDFDRGETMDSIVQPWEVESGKRYEVLMTSVHGLWRYRFGDVVEIAGFDPVDGMPIIRFIERRGVAIRFAHIMIGEKELRSAMAFVAESTLGNVVEWTATIDDRQVPRTVGFFVELAGEEVADAWLAGERILDALARSNELVLRAFGKGSFSKPTVRIVERGTFSAFRQLKLDEGCNNVGQIKVPVVLPKPAYVAWFSGRVIREL